MGNLVEREDTEQWTTVIRPKSGLLDFNLKEIFNHKFLMFLFVKRDFVSQFKQTILGPLWLVIQPLFTTGIYSVIFGGLAKLPTDGIPRPVFYMAGTTLWNYFSSCLSGSSNVFSSNAGIFSKVYFPRLVVPITGVVTQTLHIGRPAHHLHYHLCGISLSRGGDASQLVSPSSTDSHHAFGLARSRGWSLGKLTHSKVSRSDAARRFRGWSLDVGYADCLSTFSRATEISISDLFQSHGSCC